MSISNSIDNRKALLFLKNFDELDQLTIQNLPNSLESLIKPFVDNLLENTTHVFEKFIKDQEQQKALLEKNNSPKQWRLIFAMYPDFYQFSLENIFCAAIEALSDCSKKDVQQIYTCLIEAPGMTLHQIYKAEFLVWIQNEIYGLPSDSILLLLKIWRNFGQSIDQIWKGLLSLPSLNSSHAKELEVFQAKHSFIHKNHKVLQITKLETTSTSKSIRNPTSGKYLSQYILLAKALNVLLREVANSYLERDKFCPLGFQKDSWEYQLLYAPKEISPKILIWRAKNILPLYQEKLKPLIEFLDGQIGSLTKDLQEAQQKINELEYILKQIQEGIPIYGSSNVEGMKKVSEEDAQRDKANKPLSKEQIETYLENWKKIEKSLQIDLARPIAFRGNISHIEYLIKELSDSFQVKKSKQEITQDQIALIEKNQKELIQAECEYISSQKKACTVPIKESDSDSESIEESSSSYSESNNVAVDHAPTLLKTSYAEIDVFLKNFGQVNGFLSKSIDRMLKQLKIHLLKTQASDEQNSLQKEKIKEIHAQLVIATAALELIIQAIEDQRFDQVVLGFRSSLIHCHFAIEQMLSLKVLAKDGEMTTTHDLIKLAEKAHLDRVVELKFLKDIGVHLWFCYPEDYRSFYPEESSHPKPFIFLQKLLHPYNEKGKLDTTMLREAVQLCFSMYSQTIGFIIESTSFPPEDPHEFLGKIGEVQKQIQNKLGSKHFKKRFIKNKTSLSNKCNQALDILQSVNELENNQNFEELLVPINTIKRYLEFMQISLRLTQGAHSLQEFIQVETMLNMDKLFKHLFRAVILLQTGADNHSHNLSELLQLTENFYNKGLITTQEQLDLKDLNISITHHYLHKKSHAALKKDYEYIWNLAHRLNLLSAKRSILMSKGHKISYQDLKRKKERVFKKLETALDLFIKVLEPVIAEVKRLHNPP